MSGEDLSKYCLVALFGVLLLTLISLAILAPIQSYYSYQLKKESLRVMEKAVDKGLKADLNLTLKQLNLLEETDELKR